MTLFQKATRLKLRFSTSKGNLTVEDLWDLPLQSKTRLNLDDIARSISALIKNADIQSFVTETTDDSNTIDTLKLAILKEIIDIKKAENLSAKTKLENRLRKQRLTDILATKQDEKLLSLSEEELKAELRSLDSE